MHRLSNLEYSIQLSIDCQRMTANPSAKSLLGVLSMLPDGLHIKQLKQFQGMLFDVDITLCLQTLQQCSLIKFTEERYQLHPIVQHVCMLRDQYFHFFSWLLAGNSYMVTLWWCLTYTPIYLLVTRPPLTILTWPLESRWLFTNTCSFLTVTWTSWVSSTSPLLIYSSAWLVPRHALLICLLS